MLVPNLSFNMEFIYLQSLMSPYMDIKTSFYTRPDLELIGTEPECLIADSGNDGSSGADRDDFDLIEW